MHWSMETIRAEVSYRQEDAKHKARRGQGWMRYRTATAKRP
jgi:hypothetical protein